MKPDDDYDGSAADGHGVAGTVYTLVLLHAGPRFADRHRYTDGHEQFIASLIKRNLVLLGGAFVPDRVAHAAYLLRCDSVGEAAAIAAADPFVSEAIVEVETLEWWLVGINPNAIVPTSVVTPAAA